MELAALQMKAIVTNEFTLERRQIIAFIPQNERPNVDSSENNEH